MPATTDLPAPPGARAVARYVRTSASKARRVVNLVRGLPAKEALTVLRFAPQAASLPVYKVVASAIANAENNEQLDPDSLLIAEAYVDEGPTMRRYRPRAQMRPGPIRKRTCHITILVEAVQPDAALPAPRRRPRKRAGTAGPGAQAAAGPATVAQPAEAAEAAAPAVEETATEPPAESVEPATTGTGKKAAKKAAEKPQAKQAARKKPAEATAETEAPAKKAAAKKAAPKKAAPKAAKQATKQAAPKQADPEEGTE